MKNKIKNIIFNGAITYTIIIIVLMVINICDSGKELDFGNIDFNFEKLNQYKQEVSMIENIECRNVINGMIEHYENTAYNGKVNVKKLNDDLWNKWHMAGGALTGDLSYHCSISEQVLDENNFKIKAVLVAGTLGSIPDVYNFGYELTIPDYIFIENSRYATKVGNTVVYYRFVKTIELDLIEDAIEMAKEGEGNNEE